MAVAVEEMRLTPDDIDFIEMSMRHSADDSERAAVVMAKIDYAGFRNKVSWGRDLSDYLAEQMHQIRDDATLEEFVRDVDENFKHGRNEQRNAFMTAIKELAAKTLEAQKSFARGS